MMRGPSPALIEWTVFVVCAAGGVLFLALLAALVASTLHLAGWL